MAAASAIPQRPQDLNEESRTSIPSQPHPALSPAEQSSKYYKRARHRRKSFSIPTSEDEFFHVQERHAPELAASRLENNDEINIPWQIRLLEFLNSPMVQHALVGLLVLDVCILFMELAIDAFYPGCNIITRDAVSCCPPFQYEGRSYSSNVGGGNNVAGFVNWPMRVLAGASNDHHELCEAPLEETEYPSGCDSHKYPDVHVAHNVLFSFTIIILCTFELELFTMIYLIGPQKFFSHFLYVLDLFIVTVSLVLELVFKLVHHDILSDLVGLLIFFRVWRFVRIGHGLVASTFELEEEKMHELKAYVHEVEELLKERGGELPLARPKTLEEFTMES